MLQVKKGKVPKVMWQMSVDWGRALFSNLFPIILQEIHYFFFSTLRRVKKIERNIKNLQQPRKQYIPPKVYFPAEKSDSDSESK